MKKLLAVFVSLILLGSMAFAESIDWTSLTDDEITAIIEAGQQELNSRNQENGESSGGETYHYTDVDVTIVGYQRGQVDDKNALLVLVEWMNKGEKPVSLSFSGLMLRAYQNGKEVESLYDSESGQFDDYMPGYGGAASYAFENIDDSDMTFYMSDLYDIGLDDVVFTVNPTEIQ